MTLKESKYERAQHVLTHWMATDTLVGEGRVWEWPSPKGLSNHIGTLTFGTQKINCPSNYFYISESQESAWC